MNQTTHKVEKVKPKNQTKALTVEVLQEGLEQKYMQQVANYFDGDKRAAMRFITMAVDYVRKVPKLLETNPASLLNALMTIASYKFMPSPVAGEAYIIPYKTTAQFQPGYKGYVELAYRSGVKAINADIVREKDDFTIENGKLSHKINPLLSQKDRGEAVGAWVRVTLPSGETVEKYMHKDDILAHGQRFSKSFTKSDSPWNPKNDPELWMWKKTVFLQLVKWIPKNDQLIRLMEEDFKDSKVETQLLADGPATGAADHTPQEEQSQEQPDKENVIE